MSGRASRPLPQPLSALSFAPFRAAGIFRFLGARRACVYSVHRPACLLEPVCLEAFGSSGGTQPGPPCVLLELKLVATLDWSAG